MYQLDADDIKFVLINMLNCFLVFCFGQPDSHSQYLSGYHEYGPPTITEISHPTDKNLQLSCIPENLLKFIKIQDYYITWEFKACGGKNTVSCQTAQKNSGIKLCGKQFKKPCGEKLTIQKPKFSDSGIYSCQFHKKDAFENNMIVTMYKVEFIGKEKNPPEFQGDEPKNKSELVTHLVSFECRVRSPQSPASIRWVKRIEDTSQFSSNLKNDSSIIPYKNYTYHIIQGYRITDKYYIKEAGHLANGVYLSKLVIRKCEPHHAGYYACVAMNSFGINYREIFLTVIPTATIKGNRRRPPKLMPNKPKNISTIVSQTAVLECHAHSSLPPVLRWVRRIDHNALHTFNISSPIEYINNSYQLLNWNTSEEGYYRYYIDEAGPGQNDIYTSKLIFPKTNIFDTGFYACVVMNDLGIIHREVFLKVVPVYTTRDDSLPQIVLFIMLLVTLMLLSVKFLVCYEKWRNSQNEAVKKETNQNCRRQRVYLNYGKNSDLHPINMKK